MGETPLISKRLLIVDDDELVVRQMVAALEDQYEVETALTFSDAAQRIARRAPTHAVLDLILKDGSGLELLDLIRRHNPTAECIIVTGYASVSTAVEAVRLGAKDYLYKPV